ncbi:hypothetical protein SMALA_5289 [Streptomyces malaysiensis subsp. malaysiensis]|nr:hypothetical protein SMALA_5289 [Streptomyces malaysiensis]
MRRVVRASAHAQLTVVNLQEVLIQEEVGVPGTVVESAPIDGSHHPQQGVERGGQISRRRLFGEDVKSLAHQGVPLAQLRGDSVDRFAVECDAFDPCQQQSEHHRLAELFNELVIRCLREEQPSPLFGDLRENAAAPAGLLLNHRLGHLVTEQTTQAGDRPNQLRGGPR